MASPSPAKNKFSVSASYLSSSSPIIPSRSNPKPRNSETGDPMRRSFKSSPFPADPSRRNPIGRETNRFEFGDKENHNNEKDQISNLVKAPSPKGVKHFMSPTISAVSKINPSPRKKILSDKNEISRSIEKTHHQVRSSVSFSDVVSIIGESKEQEQICIDEKSHLYDEISHDVTVTDFDENYGDKGNDGFDDSSFKISPLPPCVPYTFPEFGSQEVDPIVAAPYDPKRNYLSPRPQFLHYRPNPRIEHGFDERKQLEELFISESSSSDSDLFAHESQEEEEVVSLECVVLAEEEEEEEAEVVQDEEPLVKVESDVGEEEEVVVGESIEEQEVNITEETQQIPKQSHFKTSTLSAWVLVIGVVSLLLVSSVMITQPNIIPDLHLYKFHTPPGFTKSATESFEQLTVKLRMWAEASIVYMDKLISSLREDEGYGPFQFHNLTGILEDTRLSDSVFQRPCGEISDAGLLVSLGTDIEEHNGVHQEPENGDETDLEALYEAEGNEFEKESGEGEVNSELVYEEVNKETEIKMDTDTEINGGERYSETLSEEESDGQETVGVEGHRVDAAHDQKIMEEGHGSETILVQNDVENMDEAESEAHQLDDIESAAINGHQEVDTEVTNAETCSQEEHNGDIAGSTFDISEETAELDGNDLEEESMIDEEAVNAADFKDFLLDNQKKVIILVSTLLVLLAALAAFFIAKRKAKPVMILHEEGEPTTVSEQVPEENLINERLSSLNLQEQEVDDDRRTEISSSFLSQRSFSFHKNKSLRGCNSRDDGKEHQRGGGERRKSNDSGESMASSASEYSIGSVSYGSYTTYEKIQKKSGRKEEEIVTPVRRSSRIRNHQHSGQ
ncbi:unnamed protein product [Cochlearia groenlandica]